MSKSDKVVMGFAVTILIMLIIVVVVLVDSVFNLGVTDISKKKIVNDNIELMYKGKIIDEIEHNQSGLGYDRKVIFPNGDYEYLMIKGTEVVKVEESEFDE